jgi:hypothetical protein
MSDIWLPSIDWGVVIDIEPSDRVRQLPDGRLMRESTLTLTEEATEQCFQGYRCARCLEYDQIVLLGPFPKECPTCGFAMAELQRQQLTEDFVGQRPGLIVGFPYAREREAMERALHKPKPMMTVPKEIK